VPVEEQNCPGLEDGLHRVRLGLGDADGDETLPDTPGGGASFHKAVQQTTLQPDVIEDRGGGDRDLMDRGCLADQRHEVIRGHDERRDGRALREQVGYGEMFAHQQAVESLQAEHALAMQKIGDVGGLKAGLVGEQRGRQGPTPYTAKHFKTKFLVQLCEIHGAAIDSQLSHQEAHVALRKYR